MRRSFLPLALNSIISRGHAFTQAPHATQLSLTTGKPVSASIKIASNWQETTQSPSPRQPYAQPLVPAYKLCAKAQVDGPSYLTLEGANVMPAAVNKETCTACEACVSVCPSESITMDGDGKARVDQKTCTDCGVCVDECPVEAISMT